MKGNRPGVEKDRLHVEDDEDEGEHIVTDVELDPGTADGFHARFVGGASLGASAGGAQQFGYYQGKHGHQGASNEKA